VRTESVDVVLGRLDAARRAQPGGVVAFDADGTLWSGDVGDDFFRGVLAAGRIESVADAAMRALAEEFDVPAPEGSVALGNVLYEAYFADRVPEDRICEMVAFICAGYTVEEVHDLAGRVVLGKGLAARVHPEVAHVVEWTRRVGVEAFVVSASPLAVVLAGAVPLGFDAAHIVAVTPLESGGRLRPEVARPIPYADGKVTCLRARVGSRPLYGAFGDNVFDIPLLSAAEVPVAVRPKPRLLDRAAEVLGLVRME
jgi:phosphatidylglycerophosphatase C